MGAGANVFVPPPLCTRLLYRFMLYKDCSCICLYLCKLLGSFVIKTQSDFLCARKWIGKTSCTFTWHFGSTCCWEGRFTISSRIQYITCPCQKVSYFERFKFENIEGRVYDLLRFFVLSATTINISFCNILLNAGKFFYPISLLNGRFEFFNFVPLQCNSKLTVT